MAGGDAADRAQHFGAQAAAAHAEQVDRVEAFRAELLGELRRRGMSGAIVVATSSQPRRV